MAKKIIGFSHLASLQMPGCELYQSLDVIYTFAIGGPSASSPWVIPNVPSASGLVVHTQSVVFTPGVNAFGASTTNGLQLILGVN